MNSLAVVTRAYDAEAPYIASFINHYKKRGVNEFHIVVPVGNRYSVLVDVCKNIDGIKLYYDYDYDQSLEHFNTAQNVALPNVKASHILSIDIDEYLDIDEVQPLLCHDYILFKWVVAPFSYSENNEVLGFHDGQCKYLVKKEYCKFLAIHHCELSKDIEPITSHVPLIHYVYRSFRDLYLKCTLSNYQSYQKTDLDQIAEGADDCRRLPLKFKMAAIYQRLCHSSTNELFPNYCIIDKDVEDALVKSTPQYKKLNDLQISLLNYFSLIDLHKFVDEMKQSDAYKKLGRLPHSKLAGLADKTLIQKIEPSEWQITVTSNTSFFIKLYNKLSRSFK